MALLDWAMGGKISERPRPKDFWSLETDDVPELPGAYILMADSNTRFQYPAGRSPVFYIGRADNLRRRLQNHLKWSKEAANISFSQRELYEPRYEYIAKFGGRYAYLRTWQKVTPKALEEWLLARFAVRYHSFPITNGQGSWKRISQVIQEKSY